jgi:predicted neuraminidase
MQRSADRGHNWSEPAEIEGPLGSNTRFAPVRTASGELLLPAYSDLILSSLFYSSPDGRSWTLRSAVATSPPFSSIQPSLARLNDGRLLCVMRNTGAGWLWATASRTDGRSWSQPVDSRFPNPESPAALLTLASGNLVLVFNDSRIDRKPLSIAISGDEGVTWPAKRVIANGDLEEYCYPCAVQTPDGLIHIVYSHNRESIRHIILNESWILASQ